MPPTEPAKRITGGFLLRPFFCCAVRNVEYFLIFSLCVGSGDSNPHWFHIANFPVMAVNPLKIRQYFLRNLLRYRKSCLCETASTCSAEFLQRISVRKGAGGLTPVKTDKAEGFVKIQPTGNVGSGSRCLTICFV